MFLYAYKIQNRFDMFVVGDCLKAFHCGICSIKRLMKTLLFYIIHNKFLRNLLKKRQIYTKISKRSSEKPQRRSGLGWKSDREED